MGAAPRSAGAAPRSAGAAPGVSGRILPTLPVPRGAERGRSQWGGEPGHRLCAPRPPLPRTCVHSQVVDTALCQRKTGRRVTASLRGFTAGTARRARSGGGPDPTGPDAPLAAGEATGRTSARRSRLQTCRPRSSLCSPASVVLLLLLESASPPASPLVSRAAKCRARTVPSRAKRYPLPARAGCAS